MDSITKQRLTYLENIKINVLRAIEFEAFEDIEAGINILNTTIKEIERIKAENK